MAGGSGQRVFERGAVADIGGEGGGIVAQPDGLGLERFGAAGDHRDAGAARNQHARHRKADAARCARHDHMAPAEVSHSLSPALLFGGDEGRQACAPG